MALLNSRKFVLALSVILGSFIVLKIPGLTEYKELIIAMFVVLFSVVAGTITAEDVAKINAGAPATTDEALTVLKEEIKAELLVLVKHYLEDKVAERTPT